MRVKYRFEAGAGKSFEKNLVVRWEILNSVEPYELTQVGSCAFHVTGRGRRPKQDLCKVGADTVGIRGILEFETAKFKMM